MPVCLNCHIEYPSWLGHSCHGYGATKPAAVVRKPVLAPVTTCDVSQTVTAQGNGPSRRINEMLARLIVVVPVNDLEALADGTARIVHVGSMPAAERQRRSRQRKKGKHNESLVVGRFEK